MGEVTDELMFGPDVLVAPVTTYGARERAVYLPDAASWLDAWTGNPVGAKGWVTAAAPLERIPVYLREGGSLTDLRYALMTLSRLTSRRKEQLAGGFCCSRRSHICSSRSGCPSSTT